MQAPKLLTDKQLASFHEAGYVVLPGVLSQSETSVLQAECDRLLEPSTYTDPRNIRAAHRKRDGELALEKLDPVHDISPVISALTTDPRILVPLRDIYRDEPKLFKDKLIFKLPGADGYTMHQDAIFWEVFPYGQLISVMVAIDAAPAESGALELFAGYHDQLRAKPGALRNFTAEEAAAVDEARGELLETAAGDLVLFSSLTPHRSSRNNSSRSRKQLYLTYSPSRNGDMYRAHYQHYQRYTHKTGDNNYFE